MDPGKREQMDIVQRGRLGRQVRRLKEERGIDEVIVEMAVDQKILCRRIGREEGALTLHTSMPLHKAHPITRETIIYLGLILGSTLGIAGGAWAIVTGG